MHGRPLVEVPWLKPILQDNLTSRRLVERELRNKILFSNKFCRLRYLIYVQCVVRPLETVSLWRLHL